MFKFHLLLAGVSALIITSPTLCSNQGTPEKGEPVEPRVSSTQPMSRSQAGPIDVTIMPSERSKSFFDSLLAVKNEERKKAEALLAAKAMHIEQQRAQIISMSRAFAWQSWQLLSDLKLRKHVLACIDQGNKLPQETVAKILDQQPNDPYFIDLEEAFYEVIKEELQSHRNGIKRNQLF